VAGKLGGRADPGLHLPPCSRVWESVRLGGCPRAAYYRSTETEFQDPDPAPLLVPVSVKSTRY